MLPDQVIAAIQQLEDRLLGTADLPRLHVAIAAAAILSTAIYKPSRKALRRIRTVAYSSQISLPDLGVYFYDYEYSSDSKTDPLLLAGTKAADSASPQLSKTDYFIVPTELILGIAGYMPQAPTRLQLRAEATVTMLVKNLRGYDGFYRPDPEQRISSVNQGWVAMYLALADQALRMPDTSALAPGRRAVAHVQYALFRQRPDRAWLDSSMLMLSGAAVAFATWAVPDASSWKSLTVRLLTASLGFIAGRLYAPASLKRIFVERP